MKRHSFNFARTGFFVVNFHMYILPVVIKLPHKFCL
jgi:hypothetical protein